MNSWCDCCCDDDDEFNDGNPQVVVNLVDMNDNLPVFDKEEYRVTIRENIAPGTKVVQVRHKTNFADAFQYVLVSVMMTMMILVIIMMMMMMMEHSRHCQSADLIQYSCWATHTKA